MKRIIIFIKKHERILICFLIGFLFAMLYQTNKIKNVSCRNCNIVLLSIDPLRADELPCIGYIYNTAPNICRFANQSAIFTQAYAQSSWTLPSIMSMITSTYPYEHGMLIPYQSVLAPQTLTLPQILQKNGYHTIYSGDTDNSHLPLDKGLGRGFDTVTGYKNPDDIIKLLESSKKGNKPTFLFLHNFDMLASWRNATNPPTSFIFEPTFIPPLLPKGTFIPQTWKETIYYLEQQPALSPEYTRILNILKKATSTEQAYIYFKQLSKYDQDLITSFSLFETLNMHNPSHQRLLRNLYDDRLAKVDESLAPLLTTLSKPPWRDTTIVILVSNHGDEFGEHGAMSHGTNLFASTTHVPMIIRVPNTEPTRNTDIVSTIDLYPTLLEAIGVKIPSFVRGDSVLLNILGTKNTRKKDYTVSQLGPFPWASSIRSSSFSYYENKNDNPSASLFDLRIDPQEQKNILSEHPQEAVMLKQQLDQVNATHTIDIQTP